MPRSDLPAATGGASSMLSRLVGGRALRYNRFLDKIGAQSFVAKIPKDFGADEENVVLGFQASPLNLAASTSGSVTVNAPRDCILRRLVISELGGSINFTVTSIQIEGKSYTLGGAIAGAMFSHLNTNPPEFDVPVQGGTPIQLTISNTNTAAAGNFVATFAID